MFHFFFTLPAAFYILFFTKGTLEALGKHLPTIGRNELIILDDKLVIGLFSLPQFHWITNEISHQIAQSLVANWPGKL